MPEDISFDGKNKKVNTKLDQDQNAPKSDLVNSKLSEEENRKLE